MKKELRIVANKTEIIRNLIKQESSSKFYVYLKHNNSVTYVNGVLKRNHEVVNEGDVIIVTYDYVGAKDDFLLDIPLDIIFEDDFLMIINKPNNLQTIPSTKDHQNSLYNAILNYYHINKMNNTVHFINRLDRKTGGLLLVAKDKLTAIKLSNDLYNIDRIYNAVVYDKLIKQKDTIKTYIYEERDNIIRKVSLTEGKEAITNYEVLEEYENNTSLVMLKLHTGRTHQIRVHMSYINHPLVGDELYGNDTDEDDLMLCSCSITFNHPYTNEKLTFNIKPYWVKE